MSESVEEQSEARRKKLEQTKHLTISSHAVPLLLSFYKYKQYILHWNAMLTYASVYICNQ